MDPKEKIIRGVATVSKWNGGSITVFAGLCTLFSLAFQDWLYALVGIAITYSGVMELKGRKKLLNGQSDAGKWLKGSQLWLLSLIIAYVCFSIFSFDSSDPLKDVPADILEMLRLTLEMSDQELGEFATFSNRVFYSMVLAISFMYQGGLWFYYKLKTAKLLKLEQTPS